MKQHLINLLNHALSSVYAHVTGLEFSVERPKQASHGDYATNLAMLLAKQVRASPREVAQALISALPASTLISSIEIAGAGFINFTLTHQARAQVIHDILQLKESFGRAPRKTRKVLIEYVSANPTGPLHVGHGRGAAYGASLSNLLDAAGYDVYQEYYVNDAGRQMDILALSTWLRYLEQSGINLAFPGNAYQGEYVKQMGETLASRDGTKYLVSESEFTAKLNTEDPESGIDRYIAEMKRLLGTNYGYVHQFSLETQLASCRSDLEDFGVKFDNWFSEETLIASGKVDAAIKKLGEGGHLYESKGALWFKSTAFGDEKDRVIRRENGQTTYFASDIAYHLDKFEREFDQMINIWGADHHGYIARVKGALKAMGLESNRLEIALVQFAILWRGKEKVPMSTRSGQFITLRDLCNEVGHDAARFFYILRKSDQHLDFDLELAKTQKNDNPVYYIQYAHARICSVMELARNQPSTIPGEKELALLTSPYEQNIMKRLADYPAIIESAGSDFSPHLIAYYL
ncbi:MAG: arginine--tRNA ligase, partial [Pseudomonadota bacterium]|nr:arginine--tRNA ligase [Pseudomonadota bacterium]